MPTRVDPEKEERIQQAIRFLKSGKAASIRQAAILFSIPPATLGHRMKGRPAYAGNSLRLLTESQERALSNWAQEVWAQGFPLDCKLIKARASLIANRRVGRNWVTRFLKRHAELARVKSRLLETQRGKANNVEAILHWFGLFHETMQKHKLLPENVWNMDEKGFMIGYGKKTDIIVPTIAKHQRFCVHDGNRESVTMVECVSATGKFCPPLVIMAGKIHLLEHHRTYEVREGWLWGLSNKGVTNEQLSTAWLEHCFEPFTAPIAGPKHQRSKRLLILDGHGSHVTVSFIQFCKDHNIILLCLPPHSTHYLQPLDVGLFSHYSRSYGREVSEYCRLGNPGIGKPEFIRFITAARQDSFTKSHILGGWKGTGLFPFDALHVLEKIPSFVKGEHTVLLHGIVPEDVIERMKVKEPKTPTSAPILKAMVDEIQLALEEQLGSSVKCALGKIFKAAEDSFTKQKLLEVSNQELRDAAANLRKPQAGGRVHLSKARVLTDRDVGEAVKAAEARLAEQAAKAQAKPVDGPRVTRSRAKAAVAPPPPVLPVQSSEAIVDVTPDSALVYSKEFWTYRVG